MSRGAATVAAVLVVLLQLLGAAQAFLLLPSSTLPRYVRALDVPTPTRETVRLMGCVCTASTRRTGQLHGSA